MRNGDTEKAEAFQKFLDSGQTQEAMGHWAEAVARAQFGDSRGFVESMAKAYNVRGYYDDGIAAVPEKTTINEDADGNISGTIVFMDEQTGREFSMPFNSIQELYRAGAGFLAPETVFKEACRGSRRPMSAGRRRWTP